MQCERLLKLTKSWYISVREETMAPARMVSFMERHAAECPVCQEDPDVLDEIAKITEIVLPESKIPKAVRMQNESADDDEDDYDDDDEDDENEDDDSDSDDEEEEDIYDDDDEDFEEEPDLED